MLQWFSSRRLFAGGFLLCLFLMIAALYMEHYMGLEPCPLCAFQRLFVIAIGVVALLAALHNPQRVGQRIYSAVLALLTLGGLSVALRHVWLQHLPPDKVPDCGPGLNYIMDTFPVFDALRLIFKGSGECAEVSWRFLGLFSIPELTAGFFVVMLIVEIYIFARKA
ncbi:MAG: disulfide bond formation protein B [Gammaproteobacteria bacterium]|nr:disulfide bond formation protein B [Gammaproteobacteria bacterium]